MESPDGRGRYREEAPVWCVVLAGGDGRRLEQVTASRFGEPRPKQYCSFAGGPTLLAQALERARAITAPHRTVVLSTAHHEGWLREVLGDRPEQQVVLQPSNLGTGVGIALAVLWVRAQEPCARLVFLPSDHAQDSTDSLARGMDLALRSLRKGGRPLVLLGVEPGSPDPGYGWMEVLPPDALGWSPVLRFHEKPAPAAALRLFEGGALVNTFLMAVEAGVLYRLLAHAMPVHVNALEGAGFRARALATQYRWLGPVDFSRQVIERFPNMVAAVRLEDPSWTDLGTPERLDAWLARPTRALTI